MIGQGSIGRRHAAIVVALGHHAISYDPSPAAEGPPGVEIAASLEDALERADAAVIASPSSLHAAQARQTIERGVPVLVEKPLTTDAARAAELEWLARDRGVLLAVAMNLRHHPGVLALRELLAQDAVGPVLRAEAWCGSWLPGWRPGTDYRASYSASAALGGGVLLDVAIHELDYLLWLLGPAAAVTAVSRQVSSLGLDVDDVAMIALELRSGAVAQVTVDYLDRSYHRGCRIVGGRATAHWSWEGERIRVVGGERGAETSDERAVAADVAPVYRRQMECFLAAVGGRADRADRTGADGADGAGGAGGVDRADGVVGAREARDALAVIDAVAFSSRQGRRVELPPRIELRVADEADSGRLLAWRNDPDTRRWSRSQDEVSADEHRRWLERVLSDPGQRLWIAEADGVPVGQLRLTREPDDAAELHVTVAPEARGRGLGSEIIIEAAARGLADTAVHRLIAHVKSGNEQSRRAFARAGFELQGRDDTGLLQLERERCG